MSSFEAAVYGASASIIANTIVYPLDLVKTVIQTQTKVQGDKEKEKEAPEEDKYKNSLDCLVKIYKEHGLSGLYKGLGSSLLSSAVQSFTYFYWYSFVRKLWYRLKLSHYKRVIANSTPEELLLGMVAAAIGQLFTNPISVISTRQQTNPQKNPTIVKTAQNIIKEDGITGLWRGLKVSLVLTTNPSITYATFERLKVVLFNGRKILNPHENFLLGVISKMLATAITQPLIISKAMLQMNDNNDNSDLKSFQSVLRYLARNEGVTSLWKGILPQLSKGVLVQGFVFMFKDQISVLMKTLFILAKLKRQQLLKK
jgi:hypothetical protein